MDDKNFKELDHFFTSRLRKSAGDSNGWDVPDDLVLENALDQVNAPITRKKRRPFWLWISFSLVFLSAVLYLLLKNNNQIDLLNQQVSELSHQNTNIEKTKNTIPNEEVTSGERITNIKKTPTSIIPETVIKKQTNLETSSFNFTSNNATTPVKIVTEISLIAEGQKVSKESIPNSHFTSRNAKNNIVQSFKNTPIHKAILVDKEAKEFETLSVLPYLGYASLNFEMNPFLALGNPEVEKNLSDKSKLSAFLTIGHLYASLQMTDLPQVDYTLTDYDNYYGGWEIGGGLTYELNSKNSLSAVLSYSVIDNESRFTENTAYSKSQEFSNGQGELLYNTTLEIVSPTGSHTEDIVLDVTNENFQDGETFNNQTSIYQDFRIASLTGYGTHQLFTCSDFSFNVQAGVGLNMITSTNQKMFINMMHDDHTMMSKTVSSTERYALKKLYLHGQLGLSIEKPISQHWFIGLSSGINRSLTSIRKKENNNDPKTYLGGIQSAINVGFRF